MRLLLWHPEVATRSCDDCEKYVYLEDGTQAMKFGLPMVRPKGTPTPCWKCPKIPHGTHKPTRKQAVEMSEQGWAVWRHYSECKAVGQFPDDPIVRRNAGILRQIEDRHAAAQTTLRLDSIVQLLQIVRA